MTTEQPKEQKKPVKNFKFTSEFLNKKNIALTLLIIYLTWLDLFQAFRLF